MTSAIHSPQYAASAMVGNHVNGKGMALNVMKVKLSHWSNPRKNANYGPDVNLPVPQAERNNFKFGGCTDRNA